MNKQYSFYISSFWRLFAAIMYCIRELPTVKRDFMHIVYMKMLLHFEDGSGWPTSQVEAR